MDRLIVDALLEIRSDCHTDHGDPEFTSNKYGVLFLGEKLNRVYGQDLLYVLRHSFNIDVSKDELFRMLPEICESVGMKYEARKSISSLSAPGISDFEIWF